MTPMSRARGVHYVTLTPYSDSGTAIAVFYSVQCAYSGTRRVEAKRGRMAHWVNWPPHYGYESTLWI